MKIPPQLLTVARHLGRLTEKTVFVGGMIRGLLITDPAAGAARPTDDVDLIVDVPSYKAFADLNEELRDLGFSESMEDGAPICRWVVEGIRADIMPIDPGVLGFSNVWYAGAMDRADVVAGPDGNFRILNAPHFCATKLEAFASRGGGNYLHHDLEDVIALIDGRSTLIDELGSAPDDVRKFVAEVVSGLMAIQAFVDVLPGHLEGDAGSQARLPILMERLRSIAALRAERLAQAPTKPKTRTAIPVAPRASMPAPGMPFSLPSGWVSLQSSNIRAVQYDPKTRTLSVEFHSLSVYIYSGVPETIFQGLLRAYSAGRYYNQWIKGQYLSDRAR
jgi:hypothetical protein